MNLTSLWFQTEENELLLTNFERHTMTEWRGPSYGRVTAKQRRVDVMETARNPVIVISFPLCSFWCVVIIPS